VEGFIGFFFYIFSTVMFCFIAEVREFRVCHKQLKLSRFKNKLQKNPHAVVGLQATAGVLLVLTSLLLLLAFLPFDVVAGVFLAFFLILLQGVGVSDINNVTWKSMVWKLFFL
jgi:hypothetical protein